MTHCMNLQHKKLGNFIHIKTLKVIKIQGIIITMTYIGSERKVMKEG